MRGNPDGYDLPGPPIEVSNSHVANTSFFIIYALPPYYCPSQFGSQVVQYGTSQALPVHFMPPDPPRAVAFGAPSDSSASNRASVPFQTSPQVFFAHPVQHQLSQQFATRNGFPDGSGGGYSSGSGGGYSSGSGSGYPSASGGGYLGSGGASPQVSGGGYQGSSQPPSQQSSHSGKMLLGAADGVPWR